MLNLRSLFIIAISVLCFSCHSYKKHVNDMSKNNVLSSEASLPSPPSLVLIGHYGIDLVHQLDVHQLGSDTVYIFKGEGAIAIKRSR